MDEQELSDDELRQRLNDGETIQKLQEWDGWALIEKAFQRMSKKALEELANADPHDASRITQLQQISKFYASVMGVLKSFVDSGKLAFEDAKERGLIVPKI